jgi:hypothetical protein
MEHLLIVCLQSVVIYFFVQYSYETITARTDGYGVYIYEMSTVS